MFGFLIKKSFCDGWDNLLSIFITNVLFILIAVGLWFLYPFAAIFNNPLYKFLYLVIVSIVISIFLFAYGDTAFQIADFKGIRIFDFIKSIPYIIKDAALFGVFVSFVIAISYVSITYYWSEAFLTRFGMLGLLLGTLILWLDLFCILSLMWFVPLYSTMHNPFKKTLKKCFMIFFDNTGFCFLMGIYNLVLIALSVVLLGIAPGASGLLIANANALRLRLYKYDYLEAHPELKTKSERRSIPWEELIYDDRETLGPRKIKSFIFPWKE